MKLAVGNWTACGPIDFDGKPVFPRLEKLGGLYRFSWPATGDSYIGHTSNLRSRMGGYRAWNKPQTHPELFDALRTEGGMVEVLTAATLGGQPIDLSRRDGREMVEGFLRYTLRPTLNKDG